MEHPELALTITDHNSIPIMALAGTLDAWHGPTVEVALASFLETADNELILDLTRLEFNGGNAIEALLKSLRQLSPVFRIHTIANTKLAGTLENANLGSYFSVVTSNVAEMAEGVSQEEQYLTSRWVSDQAEEKELPLAA